MTLTTTAAATTVREILAAGSCSPQCLAADDGEPAGCSCRCGGEFHGSLRDVAVKPASQEGSRAHASA